MQEETQVCPPAAGSSALVLLALFERSTGDQFQAYPGVPVARRVAALGKTLGNLVMGGAQTSLDPPLASV